MNPTASAQKAPLCAMPPGVNRVQRACFVQWVWVFQYSGKDIGLLLPRRGNVTSPFFDVAVQLSVR